MKFFVALIITCLSFFTVAVSQTTKPKQLGKLNYNGNSELKLSATVEDGQFTYTLTDLTKPDKPIFSFGLIENSLENFKKNVPDNTEEKYKKPDEKELEKYFYFFVNQNIFLIENSKGGKAMDMRFNDSFEIYSFNHPDFSTIKPKDIYFLLKELFPKSELDQSNFKKSKDYFDPNKFDSFKLVSSNAKPDKKIATASDSTITTQTSDTTKSNIQPVTVFDDSFKAQLEKINILKPKAAKWEELYKEINYRYYKALIDRMTGKLDNGNQENSQAIKRIEDSIKDASSKLQLYVKDSVSFSEERNQLQTELNKTLAQIEELKIRIPSNVDLFVLNINLVLDEGTRNSLLQKAQRNRDKISTTGITITPKILPENVEGFNDLMGLKNSIDGDSIKTEEILRNVQALAANETRRNLLISSISNLDIRISTNFQSSTLERGKIAGFNFQKDSLQKINQKDIKDDLKDLDKSNKYQFKAEKIQMEVNRGYLENIIVLGKASVFIEKDFATYVGNISAPTYSLKFINDYPIGISAKKDIERISNIKLYARFENNTHYELRLGDLISNVEEILALDRRDYSPKDDAYTVDLGKEKIKEFYKPDTHELFELKIFSDFVGINESSPNGLIQLEVDKEIPLITKRIPRPYVWAPVRFLVNKHSNLGFFNFIKPQFIFSKIEEDQRALALTQFEENQVVQYGVSTLDLKQFERFSIGTDLNLLLYNIPYAKSTFLLNGGIHFGRTDLADSTSQANEFPRSYTNTIQPSIDLLWRINGDERYGLEVSYGVNWVFSDELFFTQRASTYGFSDYEKFKTSSDNSALSRFTLLAYLNLNQESAGRIFFRYRYNSEFGDFTNNYSQLQVGYTTFLTKRENK